MITPYTIQTWSGLTYVPADTFNNHQEDAEHGHYPRKEWRVRWTVYRAQRFYGLIVIKPTLFGSALFKHYEKNGFPGHHDWELLDTRKDPDNGWAP